MGQKNAHLQAKVDPTRIFNALQFLKDSGNELYQTTQTREEYEKRCKSDDPSGFKLIFGEKHKELELEFIPEGSAEPIVSLGEYLSLIAEDKDEEELHTNDPVIRFQFEYNTDVCMVEKYPEAMELEGVKIHHDDKQNFEAPKTGLTNPTIDTFPVPIPNINISLSETFPALTPNILNENPMNNLTLDASQKANINMTEPENDIGQNKIPNQLHEVAPGEGKTPINLVYCHDWDAKAFPMLHPDGKNNLFDKRRKRKLRDQEYFKQRLFNRDPRWRRNTHWVFASAVYREKKDFKRNIDLAFKKGKKKTNEEGRSKYRLEDPYSVFQSVLNTPAYHKKSKYEFMARLDNYGPFNIFLLSVVQITVGQKMLLQF